MGWANLKALFVPSPDISYKPRVLQQISQHFQGWGSHINYLFWYL